jgi:phosphate:Na+ symporter
MDLTAIITSLLTLLAGIGVFLIACQMMSSNLEAASSEKLKQLFSKASNSKLMGVGIGALGTAVQLDFSGRSLFERAERELNFINRELVGLVVRLNGRSGLGEKDRTYLSGTYRSIRDLERIGDYAENIVEYATVLADTSQQFSDDAKYEISQLKKLLHQLYAHAMDAYQNESLESLREANFIEEEIDDYTKEMEDGHIARMEKGICTPSVGAQYLELSSNAERIADHMINIAKSIKSLKATKS